MARKPKDDSPAADEPVAAESADPADVTDVTADVTDPAEETPQPLSGFDPTRAYAMVHGGETAAKYQQDGKFYTSDGREVDAP